MMQLYRPACSKCGSLTALAAIEPAEEPGHDLRRFDCAACGNIEVVTIKFE